MNRHTSIGASDLILVVFALLVLNLWMFAPVLGDFSTHLIGDPQTDTIRGAWGLGHLHESLQTFNSPWSTQRINFPTGAEVLVLPLASGILLFPLGIVGPVLAWNLAMFLLVLATGLTVAWLTKVMCDSWTPGVAAGAMVMAQPMLHQAIADGTAEHVALWAVPLFIGATWLALHEQSPKWGIGAGLLSIVVALDSPYHGLYALFLGIFVLPWAMRQVRGREKDLSLALLGMGVSAIAGITFVMYLYGRFESGPIDSLSTESLQKTNATDLRLWWRHLDPAGGIRDISRPPTLIPTPMLIGTIALGLLAWRRSWPWLIAGLFMVGLSFGLRPKTAELLGSWLGSPMGLLGQSVMFINEWVYGLPVAGEIRFPRRWLVPAGIALSIAAGLGLQQVFIRWIRPKSVQWIISGTLALMSMHIGIGTSRLHDPFPSHALPDVEFANTIAQHDDAGPVLLLPAFRSVAAGATREELPVFANLDSKLASADDLYLQLLHQQPMVSYPSLQTLAVRDRHANVQRLLRDWSDLSHTKGGGRGIPPSAIDPGAQVERDKGLRILREAGLRWIAIDQGAYNEEGLGHLLSQLQTKIEDRIEFDQGNGVLLLQIRPPPSVATPGD